MKTDNHDPEAKLELRRHFLDRYHLGEPPHVIDCCQGGGLLWRNLCREFVVGSYWGLDLKPKAGRLKLDSVKVLGQPGWNQNVVDIDSYGSPWQHWLAMLPNISRPTTVFLTIGQRVTGTVGSLPTVAFEAMGMASIRSLLPGGLHPKLSSLSIRYLFECTVKFGIIISYAAEALTDNRNVRYVGLRLEKREV